MFHSYVTVNYQRGPRKTGQILMKRKISRVQCPQLGEGFAHVWTYPLLSISWQRKIFEHPRTIFVYCIYCIVDFLTQKGNVVLLHFKHAHRTSQYEHKIPSVWKCARLHNFCLLAKLARVSQNFARFKLGWDGWQKNMNTFWIFLEIALGCTKSRRFVQTCARCAFCFAPVVAQLWKPEISARLAKLCMFVELRAFCRYISIQYSMFCTVFGRQSWMVTGKVHQLCLETCWSWGTSCIHWNI